MQRKNGYLVWLVIAAAVAVLFLSWRYRDFRLSTQTLPSDFSMAGLKVGGMTRERALNALEVAFSTPLTLTYHDETLSLCPSLVELRYDATQTGDNLDGVLVDWRGVEGFVAHVLRRESTPIAVPVAVTYSEERVSRYLDRTADEYDGPPQEPVALPAVLDFRPPRPGYRLDIEASRARLARALVSASTQQVDLVVDLEEPPDQDLRLLRQLLDERLDDHPGLIPGIFIKDLRSGEELTINGHVPFSGLSVLKIGVLEEVYRSLDRPPGPETTKLISETMTESGNFTANLLLRDIIGHGDAYEGAEEVTDSMKRLGLLNTFMGAPYDEKDVGSQVVTDANSQTDVSTEPDPFIQTTPLDVGLLLEMIYQCTEGGGALILNYRSSVTPTECREMVDWMTANPMDSLIARGVPAGTQVAHKHGWTSDTHADAGLVYSPGRDYVLVVFLYRDGWLEWDEGASLIADISTATYNYFNP